MMKLLALFFLLPSLAFSQYTMVLRKEDMPKAIPYPTAVFSGYSLQALFVDSTEATIISFDVSAIVGGFVRTESSYKGRLSPGQNALIAAAGNGKVFFDKILVLFPDGITREIKPLVVRGPVQWLPVVLSRKCKSPRRCGGFKDYIGQQRIIALCG